MLGSTQKYIKGAKYLVNFGRVSKMISFMDAIPYFYWSHMTPPPFSPDFLVRAPGPAKTPEIQIEDPQY